MIALDTSSVVHYLAGSSGSDVDAVDLALSGSQACLPCVVVCELLSDPKLPTALEQAILRIPMLSPKPGFWQRAGRLRAGLIEKGRKAKLADTLIAQTCIDHGVALVTRDPDFARFVASGLRIV